MLQGKPMPLHLSSYKQAMTMLMAVSLSALSLPLYGNPTGGQVASGNITIQNNGNVVTINQKGSKGIINWNTFDISPGETVKFNNKGDTTLNRINSNTESTIDGNLIASGKIFLINPHGIVFGLNAQVNVGSIVASVANISDSNFLAGNYDFNNASNDPNAEIINHGHISTIAKNGLIALVGPGVVNDGVIQANLGKVALGTGDRWTLDMTGDGLINFDIGQASVSKLYHIDNTGSIIANAGSIMLTAQAVSDAVHSVINVDGIVQAQSVAKVNGKIVFGGAQQVNVSGTVDASGTAKGQTGGQIEITGDQIEVGANNTPATITASGDQGGGSILIGGDSQGGGTLAHAQNTTVDAGSVLTADAITQGDGGKVVVWSDNTTEFHGTISAQGGAQGGDGGSVETSGMQSLDVSNASVNAGSTSGKNGSWLLDPGTDTIDASQASSIEAALESHTDTTIQAQKDTTTNDPGDIDVTSNITWDTNSTLNLIADNNINVEAVIKNAPNPLNTDPLNTNPPSGNLNLRADADADNVGTVNFLSGGKVDFSNSAGNVNIFYNPAFKGVSDPLHPFAGVTLATYGTDGSVVMGSGHYNAYVLVNNLTDLSSISSTPSALGYSFALGATIDGGGINNTTINSIGTSSAPFTGTFFGNSYTIQNLTITNSAGQAVGLFGTTSGANLDNIQLNNINIAAGGQDNVGAVVGQMNNSFLQNAIVQNSTINGQDNTGGAVGNATNSTLAQVFVNNTTVKGTDSLNNLVGNNVGGLVGNLSGSTVTQSVANATVSGNTAVGGAVGSADSGSNINNSFAVGQVSATDQVGGFSRH